MSHAHVLDGYYDDLIPAIPRPHIGGRFLVAIAGVAVLGAALVFGTPTAVETYREYHAAQVKAEAAQAAWAARVRPEIPVEWQMQPRPLKLNHMFRRAR